MALSSLTHFYKISKAFQFDSAIGWVGGNHHHQKPYLAENKILKYLFLLKANCKIYLPWLTPLGKLEDQNISSSRAVFNTLLQAIQEHYFPNRCFNFKFKI